MSVTVIRIWTTGSERRRDCAERGGADAMGRDTIDRHLHEVREATQVS
jgi:hypothetical protein